MADDLAAARETDQEGQFSKGKLWDYRWLGMWNHRFIRGKSHDGRNGC